MPKAKYEEIYQQLKKQIESRAYPYQTLLPSEHQLVAQYGCSRNTVRRALAELAECGYVQPIHGKGVRVIYHPAGRTNFLIGGIETFQETARRNALHAVTKVLRFEQIEASEALARETGFAAGDKLWAIERVRLLDGKALILDQNYFLCALVPGLTPDIAARSIYEYIEKELGMQIVTSKRKITVEHTTLHDEECLEMNGYDCVAVTTSQTFNADGLLFECTRSRHQPEYFCFEDTATRKRS